MEKEIRLPDVLLKKGFSIDTHAFRYRPDTWKDESGVLRNFSLEEIENSVIWHAAIGSLNDPFEVYARSNKRELHEMSNEEHFKLWAKGFAKHQIPHEHWRIASEQNLREHYKSNELKAKAFMFSMIAQYDFFSDFVTELRTTIAISSFTKVCNSRLMWGYYCNGLQGFCIIYNRERLLRSRIELQKVSYSERSHQVNVFDFTYGYRLPRNNEILTDIPKAKHKEWEHENELRSLYILRGDEVGKGAAIKMDENCIDGIIIGSCISDKTKNAVLELSKQRGFNVFEAEANLEDFCIEVRNFS